MLHTYGMRVVEKNRTPDINSMIFVDVCDMLTVYLGVNRQYF